MKKSLTAVYRITKGGNISHTTNTYFSTKKAFEKELKGNGFVVLGIYTEEQIVDVKQKYANGQVEEYIQQVVPTPEGVTLLEAKRVNIGSYYVMQDGRTVYAGYHGQLILHELDGSGKMIVHDVDAFNKALTHGEIVEVNQAVETLQEPVRVTDRTTGDTHTVIKKHYHMIHNTRITLLETTEGTFLDEKEAFFHYFD